MTSNATRDRGESGGNVIPPQAGGAPTAVDWDALRQTATAAAHLAYCPYSGLQVGAAAITDTGRVVTGCNVENASYGLGLCAECTLVGQLRLSGDERLVALACRSGSGDLLMPCGRCRQVIYEFGGPGLLVDTPEGPQDMRWVLPAAFGPEHLPGARERP